jgi:hypothetical protein
MPHELRGPNKDETFVFVTVAAGITAPTDQKIHNVMHFVLTFLPISLICVAPVTTISPLRKLVLELILLRDNPRPLVLGPLPFDPWLSPLDPRSLALDSWSLALDSWSSTLGPWLSALDFRSLTLSP